MDVGLVLRATRQASGLTRDLAPRAGLEPATLRLTVGAKRIAYRVRWAAMLLNLRIGSGGFGIVPFAMNCYRFLPGWGTKWGTAESSS